MRDASIKRGITFVIVTYNRKTALRCLIKSILSQELGGINTELLLINNYPKHFIRKSKISPLGRMLSMFENVKIFNSSYNWSSYIRYHIAGLAENDIILMLDDDVILIDNKFISKMYYAFVSKNNDNCIFSSWCAKIKPEKIDYFDTKSFSFEDGAIKEIVEVDLIGPGISMFNKKILIDELVNIPKKYRIVDNIWFSIMSTVLLGTKKYYFPSHGMVRFHRQHVKSAMYSKTDVIEEKKIALRELISKGYPV